MRPTATDDLGPAERTSAAIECPTEGATRSPRTLQCCTLADRIVTIAPHMSGHRPDVRHGAIAAILAGRSSRTTQEATESPGHPQFGMTARTAADIRMFPARADCLYSSPEGGWSRTLGAWSF